MEKPLNIKLTGNIPPKKNSRQTFVKNGRLINIPSQRYKDWHKDATTQLIAQKCPKLGLAGVYIEYQLFAKDKRAKDASNTIESINDLLVDYGMLKDDNWFTIEEMHVLPVIVDKIGGAEIMIL